MAITGKYQHKKKCWLKISANNLIIFETGSSSDGLPSLKIKATLQTDAPLTSANKHAAWVKKHAPKKINLLLADDHYQLLLSDVPDVPAEELDAAIELKAADLLSYDLDDAIMDVLQLPNEAYRGRMKMAFIVATRKKPVIAWLEALIQLGIRVDLIDISTTQLRNLGLACQNHNESGIFQIHRNKSRLILNYKNEMVLNRSFDIGLKDLIEPTTVQDGELELTVEDNTQSAIQMESLTLEVRRSIDYYESQLGLGPVAEIQLLCDEAHQAIAEKIAAKLGVRFTSIRPEDFMHLTLENNDQDRESFYNLIGTIFREAI